MTVSLMSAWTVLIKGGPLMIPIFLLSVLAMTVGLEKFLFLNKLERNIKKFKPAFFKALQENRMKDALVLCEADSRGIGVICKAGLMKFGSSVDVLRITMEEAAGFEIYLLKQRLDILVFVVNAVVLLGLLGTTTALCVVFHAVYMRSNALNPLSLGDMASGIWQALVCTSAGLSVGIVSFAVYSFTASRVNAMIAVFERMINATTVLMQSLGESNRLEETQ